MKNIKDCKIKTQEGFELKNLQRFPSMEWGDEGGMKAHLYYQGSFIMEILQEGNGGCACCYTNDVYKAHELEIKLQCLRFLKRVDDAYGPNSKYDWLKNKTINKINDDDWEAVATNIENRFDDIKLAQKAFKQGYKAIALLRNDWQTATLNYKVENISREDVLKWLNKNPDVKKQYPEFEIIRCTDKLNVF